MMTADDFLRMAAACKTESECAEKRGLTLTAEQWERRASWCYRQSAMQRRPDIFAFTSTDVPPPKQTETDR